MASSTTSSNSNSSKTSSEKSSGQSTVKNNAAVFSGDKSGSLAENQASVTGKLNVSDTDKDQSSIQPATLKGENGKLAITSAGNWTYTLTRDMNYLKAGEAAVEKFTVKSADGTEQVLSLTVNGLNEVKSTTKSDSKSESSSSSKSSDDNDDDHDDNDHDDSDDHGSSNSGSGSSSGGQNGDKDHSPGSTTGGVAGQTGAAKDETITGISEDATSTNLNVLANDPGSAALWSIDQNALNTPAGSQLPKNVSSVVTLASGASISVNADGTIKYVGGAAVQSLQEGELFNDSFIYVIRMANGALSTAKATVQIVGKNDVAVITGDKSGALTEDQASVAGKLNVADVDHDQSAMQAASLVGTNGNLNINSAGNWTYTLTRDMNYLQVNESVSESFTVKSVDGTTQVVTLTVNGVNDAATFSGDKSGALTEDQTSVAGKLNVADLDHDQSAMQAASVVGTNGNLAIDAAGNWSYGLTRDMNYLQANESVSENITVLSVDGTTQVIAITINGVNDVATFTGDKSGALTEDQTSVAGKLNVADLDHDQSAMQAASVAGTNGNLSIDAAGNWSYGLTRDMNYLGANQSASESFTVKSVDGTEQVLTLTVTGVNDAATFGGQASGSVQEDGVLSASGVLTVADVDQGQAGFLATGNLTGTYGDFTFNLENGAWTYALRNSDANVQALISGQNVQESLSVSSIDGSASNIVITIGGQNEPVVAVNPADKWNVNKINVTKSGGGLDSQVAYDVNGVARIVGFDSNDELHPIGAMGQDNPFQQLIDTDNNGSLDSTRLNFNYKDGNNPLVHVDVILVGYTSFTTAQLFAA